MTVACKAEMYGTGDRWLVILKEITRRSSEEEEDWDSNEKFGKFLKLSKI